MLTYPLKSINLPPRFGCCLVILVLAIYFQLTVSETACIISVSSPDRWQIKCNGELRFMPPSFSKKGLISLKNWSADDVLETVDRALEIKTSSHRFTQTLCGKTVALLFQKTSTRTRCAGEIGIAQMGGHSVYLDWQTTNFVLADLRDEIRTLSSYTDLILARLLTYEDIVISDGHSTVPIVNGCCNRYHPTQAIGDLMTIKEKLGRLEGVKLTYVGMPNNVSNSLIRAGMLVGMLVTVIAPEKNPLVEDSELYQQAKSAGTYFTTHNLKQAVKNSDVIYTDTWVDMEFFTDPNFVEEKRRRTEAFQPYQINHDLLGDHQILIMHCLAAHRGYEITGELLSDPRSIVFCQAENRLHSMKSIFYQLLS